MATNTKYISDVQEALNYMLDSEQTLKYRDELLIADEHYVFIITDETKVITHEQFLKTYDGVTFLVK